MVCVQFEFDTGLNLVLLDMFTLEFCCAAVFVEGFFAMHVACDRIAFRPLSLLGIGGGTSGALEWVGAVGGSGCLPGILG